MSTPAEVLQQVFGYSQFRPGQQEIIDAILSGSDVLTIMPTGGGKSICYQVPALLMEGITLVVSPLIALMKDQVSALVNAGVPAAFLNSSLNSRQYAKALNFAKSGRYKIIYVAPERLLTPSFLDFAQNVPISMVAVDEAHCVSQWGQGFRPDYLKIEEFVSLLPNRPRLCAFTATATGRVKSDIVHYLALQEPRSFSTSFDRPNLYFGVERPADKKKAVLEYVEAHADASGIIYCLSRANVEEICSLLQSNGFPATRYHAGLSDAERRRNQEDFIYERTPIMVATNAFGMGIDKSNVRYVLHYNMPGSLESYYQEAGRAGRDGEKSECILYYSPQDINIQRFLIDQNEDNESLSIQEQEEVRKRDYIRLYRMRDYCTTTSCLRQFILDYFDQPSDGRCGNCSSCNAGWQKKDMTSPAGKVGHLLLSLPRSYGASMLIDILRGSSTERIRKNKFYDNDFYGTLAAFSKADVQELIDGMLQEGFLERSHDEYQTIQPTRKLLEALQKNRTIELLVRSSKKPVSTRPSKTGKPAPSAMASKPSLSSSSLFGELKALRLQLARDAGVPPYIVFNDQTLLYMAKNLPKTEAEMLQIPGVGKTKMERYGQQFLDLLQNHKPETEQ